MRLVGLGGLRIPPHARRLTRRNITGFRLAAGMERIACIGLGSLQDPLALAPNDGSELKPSIDRPVSKPLQTSAFTVNVLPLVSKEGLHWYTERSPKRCAFGDSAARRGQRCLAKALLHRYRVRHAVVHAIRVIGQHSKFALYHHRLHGIAYRRFGSHFHHALGSARQAKRAGQRHRAD